MNGADAGAGMDRGEHVERADQPDIGVAGQQHAHRVGIAGDMDVLNLEIAQPALLLRHQIGQRKRRDRPGEDHLDLGGERGGRVRSKHDREAANAQPECAPSNMMLRHDNSLSKSDRRGRLGKMSLSGRACKRFLPCPCGIPVAGSVCSEVVLPPAGSQWSSAMLGRKSACATVMVALITMYACARLRPICSNLSD